MALFKIIIINQLSIAILSFIKNKLDSTLNSYFLKILST